MKAFILVIFFTSILINANAQYALFLEKNAPPVEQLSATALNAQLSKYDFSRLFACTDNSEVYGFIGISHQRLRIKFIRVYKDTLSANTYHIYGKSMVKNNIDEFKGTIIIKSIAKQKTISYGVDEEYKNRGFKGEFIISGNYILYEDSTQNHSGFFKGNFRTGFYLDREYKVHYDDIDITSDGYCNNLFIGNWTDYKIQRPTTCNWGDYRIPNAGDFDQGAGDFSPNTTNNSLGWQNINDHSKWWK